MSLLGSGQHFPCDCLANMQKESLRFKMCSRVTALFPCAVGLEVYLGHSAVSGPWGGWVPLANLLSKRCTLLYYVDIKNFLFQKIFSFFVDPDQ